MRSAATNPLSMHAAAAASALDRSCGNRRRSDDTDA
jgi:hypothetical protein